MTNKAPRIIKIIKNDSKPLLETDESRMNMRKKKNPTKNMNDPRIMTISNKISFRFLILNMIRILK